MVVRRPIGQADRLAAVGLVTAGLCLKVELRKLTIRPGTNPMTGDSTALLVLIQKLDDGYFLKTVWLRPPHCSSSDNLLRGTYSQPRRGYPSTIFQIRVPTLP